MTPSNYMLVSTGTIFFPPSFKYDKGSDKFDSSSKARTPAWTDRILFSSGEKSSPINENSGDNVSTLKLKDYYSITSSCSDHRPVCADFILTL